MQFVAQGTGRERHGPPCATPTANKPQADNRPEPLNRHPARSPRYQSGQLHVCEIAGEEPARSYCKRILCSASFQPFKQSVSNPLNGVTFEFPVHHCSFRGDRLQIVPGTYVTVFWRDV